MAPLTSQPPAAGSKRNREPDESTSGWQESTSSSSHPPNQQQRQQQSLHKRRRKRVLVLGAGMSGLACARELQSRHYDVLVLEARNRVGGRLKSSLVLVPPATPSAKPTPSSKQTRSSPRQSKLTKKKTTSHRKASAGKKEKQTQKQTPVPPRFHSVDLGGSLIHGIQDNPLSTLTRDLRIPTQAVQDCLLMDDSGWPVDAREDERMSVLFNECLDDSFHRAAALSNGGSMASNNSIGNGSYLSSTKAPRQTRSTALSAGTSSFQDLFQQVKDEKGVADSALLQWHKANLEISCGAGFDRLGWAWNEDEPFGYDGEHHAVVPSWKAVVEGLADSLDVWHGAVVRRVQIIHPSPQDSNTVTAASNHKRTKVEVHVKRRAQPETVVEPTRRSRRIRGDEADVRRSARSNKGSVAERFSMDQYDLPQQQTAPAPRKQTRKTHSYAQVTVELAESGKTVVLEADAVVCTLPLSILKQSLGGKNVATPGGVVFDPPLTSTKQEAIRKLGAGLLNKCVLSFSRVFWQDSDFLGLAAHQRAYLVLNVASYTGEPILMFMYGGNFARDIENWTDSEVVEDCLAVLKRICGQHPPDPIDYQVSRWSHERFSNMAFTYVPPGVDGFSELSELSRPVNDHEEKVPVLMFAGEHTTPYHPSTIHGAFLSGVREAYRLECALVPEDLGGMVFSEEELYQRTFLVDPTQSKASGLKHPRSQTTNGDESFASSRPNGSRSRQQHRRRGPSGVMNFLNSSEHSESSTVRSFSQANIGSPVRRSHRAGTLISPSNGGLRIDRNVPAMEVDPDALEDRMLLRSVESYGPDYSRMQKDSLPVYGSNSPKPKSLVQIQRRCHKLTQLGRNRKNRSSKIPWKSWIAPNAHVPGTPTPRKR